MKVSSNKMTDARSIPTLIFTLLLFGCGEADVSIPSLSSAPADEATSQDPDLVEETPSNEADREAEPSSDQAESTGTTPDDQRENEGQELDESNTGLEADEEPETDPAEDTADETAPPSSGDCSLSLSAVVRDQAGPCSSCTSGDYLTLVGLIENPCSDTLTYRSELDCLVSEFEVHNMVEGSTAEYPMTCRDEVALEELEPGGFVNRTRPAGRLSAGSYRLTVQFEDLEQTEQVLFFSVE